MNSRRSSVQAGSTFSLLKQSVLLVGALWPLKHMPASDKGLACGPMGPQPQRHVLSAWPQHIVLIGRHSFDPQCIALLCSFFALILACGSQQRAWQLGKRCARQLPPQQWAAIPQQSLLPPLPA